MPIIHPLAKFYNTPEEYEKLQRAYEPWEKLKDIELTIDGKVLDSEIKEVMEKIEKDLAKVFK